MEDNGNLRVLGDFLSERGGGWMLLLEMLQEQQRRIHDLEERLARVESGRPSTFRQGLRDGALGLAEAFWRAMRSEGCPQCQGRGEVPSDEAPEVMVRCELCAAREAMRGIGESASESESESESGSAEHE